MIQILGCYFLNNVFFWGGRIYIILNTNILIINYIKVFVTINLIINIFTYIDCCIMYKIDNI